jgi:hypothetical protein
MQVPPHAISDPMQWQTPETHWPFAGHALPQPPQFCGSEDTSTHVPLLGHRMRGEAQAALQTPPEQ